MLNDLLEINAAKILIADEDKSSANKILSALKHSGFSHVININDYKKGLEYYQNNPLDLVLLGLEKSTQTPIEILKGFTCADHSPNPPVIVMTTCNEKKNRLNVLNAGAKDFICKPFDFDELLIRVSNLLEMHLAHKEIADHNGTLDHIIKARSNQLRATQYEIIERLSIAAEYKDTDTGLHTKRVGLYAKCLAKAMGFNKTVCEDLLLAAPLHDIGKIGIPDKVLLKPGKLDAAEWEIMQKHTSIGSDILSGSKSRLLKNAEIIALTHHERWDGNGYPNGLKNIETHLYGRVTAIADVYDALTMERPYKKAWTTGDALDFIDSGKGSQFDPELVDAFNSVKDEIITIKQHFSDSPKLVA